MLLPPIAILTRFTVQKINHLLKFNYIIENKSSIAYGYLCFPVTLSCLLLKYNFASCRIQLFITWTLLLVVQDSVDFNSVDWEETDGLIDYLYSSSEEDSDEDVLLQPITDVDLPITKGNFPLTDDTITLTAYRFAVLGKAQNRRK